MHLTINGNIRGSDNFIIVLINQYGFGAISLYVYFGPNTVGFVDAKLIIKGWNTNIVSPKERINAGF